MLESYAYTPRRWTNEEIATAVKLYHMSMTYTEIGERLGKTKGQISGILRRAGAQGKRDNNNGHKKLINKPKPLNTIKKDWTFQETKTKTPYRPKPLQGPCTLLEAREDSCRWIIGEPRNGIICGQPVAQRNTPISYCDKHARECFKGFSNGSLSERGGFKLNGSLIQK